MTLRRFAASLAFASTLASTLAAPWLLALTPVALANEASAFATGAPA